MELIIVVLFTLTFLPFTELSADKVYLPDIVKVVGLSNKWSKSPSCTGSYWNYQNNRLSPIYFYAVCFSKDCILETSPFNIKYIKTVFADVVLEGRKCTGGPREPVGCTEYIEIGANKGDVQIKQFIGKSTEFRQFPSNIDNKVNTSHIDFFKSTGTIDFDNSNDKTYIKFQFNSQMHCGTLKNFVVYYYKCPRTTDELVEFNGGNAPSKSIGVETYKGRCVANAVNVDGTDLIMKCKWNGVVEITGECVCDIGHAKVYKQCKKCGIRKFKEVLGNDPCSPCGEDSFSTHDGKFCRCKQKFFREKGKELDSTARCFELPVPPTSIQVSNITAASACITWIHSPYFPGTYTISCENCPKNQALSKSTNKTSIHLSGLGSYAEYQFQISFTFNHITIAADRRVSADFNLTTKPGNPGKVQNLRQTTLKDGSVELNWDEPFAKGNDEITYLITFDGYTKTTTTNKFFVESDTQTRSYNVKVVAQVNINRQSLTGDETLITISVKGGISLKLAVGVGVGVGVLLVIIVICAVIFFIWKKKSKPHPEHVVLLKDDSVHIHTLVPRGPKLYIDPTTYDDVWTAAKEHTSELDKKNLTIGNLLGSGEFAEVYGGTLTKDGKTHNVAIKTLKSKASIHDQEDFISEAAIVGQFTDPNVILLEGVILKEQPYMIVLECMVNGALDKYLQKNDMQFTTLQLLGMARGVASGMKYLNELGFIHRDLAARNILVDELRVCKFSDFGMSREIQIDDTYESQRSKVPVRWTAPEAIQFKKFTTASDVWSYGILLWEIMSYGERPYSDWGNYKVLEQLGLGYRMPAPMNCPIGIHELMLYCWNKDRSRRPKMVELKDCLETCIRNPNILDDNSFVDHIYETMADYTELETIGQCLIKIGFENYTKLFLDQGFVTLRQIIELTLEDLENLGIESMGDRERIYKAARDQNLDYTTLQP